MCRIACLCWFTLCTSRLLQTFVKIPLYVSAACMLYDVVTKSPADACICRRLHLEPACSIMSNSVWLSPLFFFFYDETTCCTSTHGYNVGLNNLKIHLPLLHHKYHKFSFKGNQAEHFQMLFCTVQESICSWMFDIGPRGRTCSPFNFYQQYNPLLKPFLGWIRKTLHSKRWVERRGRE